MVNGGTLFLISTVGLPAQLVFQQTERTEEIPASASFHSVQIPFQAEGPVTLKEISEKCSCMKAAFSSEKTSWTQGEKGTLNLTLDATLIKGSTRKSLDLHFTDHPSQTITLNAQVPIGITCDVKTQRWKVGEKPETKHYLISLSPDFPLEIETISRSSTTFDFQLTPVENTENTGKKYRFSVTPNDLSQKAFCLFKLETNSEIERYKSFSLMALIQEGSAPSGKE